jgi:hypothetical protein
VYLKHNGNLVFVSYIIGKPREYNRMAIQTYVRKGRYMGSTKTKTMFPKNSKILNNVIIIVPVPAPEHQIVRAPINAMDPTPTPMAELQSTPLQEAAYLQLL